VCVELAEIGKADPEKTIIFGHFKLARLLDVGMRRP
jgi:hypothetical protein